RSCMAADTTRKPGWGRRRPTPGRDAPRSPDDGAPALHQDDVAPRLTKLAKPFARADDAEAAALVQRDAGLVLGEDARLERPDSRALGRFDQCPQEASADALAARTLGHVDHLLRDAAVDVAARVGNESRPAEDDAIRPCDEAGIGEARGIPD